MIILSVGSFFGAFPAAIAAQSDWIVGVGISHIRPNSGVSTLNLAAGDTLQATVGSNTQPSITAEYAFTPNLGAELFFSTPIKDTITLTSATSPIHAQTNQLSPILSLNYHFNDLHGAAKPYIGAGIHYSTFSTVKHDFEGIDIKLENNTGFAVQAGVDYHFSPSDAVRINARYLDVHPKAILNDDLGGSIAIKPMIYSMAYVKAF